MATTDIGREAVIDKISRQVTTGLDLGTDDAPAQISSNSDEMVTLYSMIDGEPRSILNLDVPRVLRKVLPNGSPAFWHPDMPGAAPEYTKGQIKCMLHPDFDESEGPAQFDRQFIDGIGLTGRTCNLMAPDKANVADFHSVFDRDDHMAKKHRREWATIQDALQTASTQRYRNEDRQTREAMLALAASATGQAQSAATTVSTAAGPSATHTVSTDAERVPTASEGNPAVNH
ncbi:MAG: hypothetical protein V3S28_05645, partial [Acidimicrobiia bacterium]